MNTNIKFLIESLLTEDINNIYDYDPYMVFVVNNDFQKIYQFSSGDDLSYMNGQIWYQGGFSDDQIEMVENFVYNEVQNLKLHECAIIKNKQGRKDYTIYVIKQN